MYPFDFDRVFQNCVKLGFKYYCGPCGLLDHVIFRSIFTREFWRRPTTYIAYGLGNLIKTPISILNILTHS